MNEALEVHTCSRCDRDSIIHQPYSGLHLCGTHLVESVRKRIGKSLRKQLILPKNSIKSLGRPFRVLVAISGGKDSAILLYFLNSILGMRRDVELIAGVVDEGIDGYRSPSIDSAEKLCTMLDVQFERISYPDLSFPEMDNVVKLLPKISENNDEADGMMPCSFCGVFRRQGLNSLANRIGADVMALATGTGNANLWLDASNGDLSGADYAVVFHNNATLDLEIANYAADIILKTRNGSLGLGGLNTAIHCHENGAIDFRHDGGLVAQTKSNGINIYTGGSSHIGFYDVHTNTWDNYTNSVNLRWYDDVNNDNVMELSQAGNLNIDGSYSNSGVDYAEYFESTDGSVIPVGTTVVLDNGKVRAATSSETPIGVIRPKTSGTSVTGGVNQLNWQGKYLVDDYDGQLMESAVHCTWDDANGDHQQCWKDRPPTGVTIPSDAEERTMDRPKLNPLFDESKTYVPRSERDEWNCVGLLGQIPITKGQPTSSNWIKMKDRSATVELWMVK